MQIVPTDFVQLPLDGTADTLEIIVQPFPLFPTSINIFWKVSGLDTSKEGVIALPSEIIAEWGTDDTVVQNYVISQLGVVAVTTTTTTTTIIEETTTTTTTV
jgi:hypothetical protein